MKVLVVDDNRSYYWIHRRKLTSLKADISFASNSKEAVEEMSGNSFDVVLIQDALCNGCKGPELYDKIRKFGYKGPLFVLFSDKETKRHSYNGISGLIHKRMSGRKLCEVISESISNSNLPRENSKGVKSGCILQRQ